MRSFVLFLATLILSGCVPPVQSPSSDAISSAARVDALADEVVRAYFHEFPEYATLEGYPTADHARLSNNSFAAVADFYARLNSWLARARQTDPAQLAGTPQH